MREVERLIMLLLAAVLDLAGGAELEPELKKELAELGVVIGTRNRAGADLYNRRRTARAAAGIVAVDEGFAPRQPIAGSNEPHEDTVALQQRVAEVDVDDLVGLVGRRVFPERNQEL